MQSRTAELVPAELSANVPLRDGKTVADQVGAAPEWTLSILGLLACAAALLAGRRRRGRLAGTPDGDEPLTSVAP